MIQNMSDIRLVQYYTVDRAVCNRKLCYTLKGNVVYTRVCFARKEENLILFEYIEVYYNRIKKHSANGWLSLEIF